MKINADAIMSEADWALYEAEPIPKLPPPTKPKPNRPIRPPRGHRWRRIINVQNPCGCLVIRFEPYAGRAVQRACPHTGGW